MWTTVEGGDPAVQAGRNIVREILAAVAEGSETSYVALERDFSEKLVRNGPHPEWLSDVKEEWIPFLGALAELGVVVWSEESWGWVPGPNYPRKEVAA